ncbi:hypothetical protein AB0A95_11270 [Micromonospora sp. NPDC049230]|uniref:VOC family protein n=1 Tax=Micromonospora sp. NPDC049230 TaxID=3155502 RepID=UPI00340A5CB1
MKKLGRRIVRGMPDSCNSASESAWSRPLRVGASCAAPIAESRTMCGWPAGSACSVQFGPGLTSAAPGLAMAYLVVSDIEATHDTLVAAGVEVGDVFHVSPDGPVDGPDPQRRSYFSRATLRDPDGNTWLLQEITARLPGRIEGGLTSFGSASDLAGALRRAAAAHGEHEKRTGQHDDNWPDWYAAYLVSEQSGAKPRPREPRLGPMPVGQHDDSPASSSPTAG